MRLSMEHSGADDHLPPLSSDDRCPQESSGAQYPILDTQFLVPDAMTQRSEPGARGLAIVSATLLGLR